MNVFYQLIDRTTGNVIKDYVTKLDLLNELDAMARANGFDEIRDYALITFQDGSPNKAAMDDELVALVRAVDPEYWVVETAIVGAARRP